MKSALLLSCTRHTVIVTKTRQRWCCRLKGLLGCLECSFFHKTQAVSQIVR
uniref:Uncharacterized protein n=1 Tax=Anguilla anguilla TaxID=7936 RepID=A0A0E9SUK9_ANGAN